MNQTKAEPPGAASAARETSPTGGLVVTADTPSLTEAEKAAKRRERRSEGYIAREWLWENSSSKRTADCGRVPTATATACLSRSSTGQAFFSGLQTCASAALCPVCAAKIRAGRAIEVEKALHHWRETNRRGEILFVTLTLRHHAGHKLADLLDVVSYAWESVVSGKGWADAKAAHGIDGFVRVTEVTHGRNGWHAHIHAAIPVLSKPSKDEREAFEKHLFGRWQKALERKGFSALKGVGVDVRRTYSDSGLGRYMTKAAVELTHGDLKVGRAKSSRTPFRILRDVAMGTSLRPDRDQRLWAEWEAASHHRRFIGWSKNLRAYLAESKSDAELAEAEQQEPPVTVEVVAEFPGDAWSLLRKARGARGLVTLLDTCEVDGAEAARALLDEWGVAWVLPGETPEPECVWLQPALAAMPPPAA